MNKTEVMKELQRLGNERFLKTFGRHGVTGKAFGVPYADLYKLQKQIGVNQKLAEQIWGTGVHDARVLAALVADPEQMTATKLDGWAKQINNELTLQAVGGMAAKSPTAPQRMRKWIKSKQEWMAASGWFVVAALSTTDRLDDDEVETLLEQIESAIHDSPNRVKHTMNGTLIAISGRNAAFQKKAIAAARRIGKVDVDHGDTSCRTPDAETYIKKMAVRKKTNKTTKKKTRKKVAAR
jgi:3-methyladenine DNA glycosylase AlkD